MCRGIEALLESEECRGQKENRASLVQMPVRGYLVFQDPRVLQLKMGLRVTLAHKDFLVCPALTARKESAVQRVTQVIQVLWD